MHQNLWTTANTKFKLFRRHIYDLKLYFLKIDTQKMKKDQRAWKGGCDDKRRKAKETKIYIENISETKRSLWEVQIRNWLRNMAG